MKLQVRYANHPDDSKHYTTAELRRHYLMEKVFEADLIYITVWKTEQIIIALIAAAFIFRSITTS